ncbi:hypothetical protein XFLAVUS301_53550 [Xanthobacter flavus]|uniref:Uncharacterized protein n=1 Tax=Xanthobacter flavus TaxID=281 RepID=A0A9W6FMP9_XANFL|nr:hypothetical protein XFLAVUS301_53550 [Xanthobacter flavus]
MRTKLWRGPALRATTLIAATLTLAGCATTTGTGATKVYCGAAAPIRWSHQDTDETIRQAKAANAVGRELCGWK